MDHSVKLVEIAYRAGYDKACYDMLTADNPNALDLLAKSETESHNFALRYELRLQEAAKPEPAFSHASLQRKADNDNS